MSNRERDGSRHQRISGAVREIGGLLSTAARTTSNFVEARYFGRQNVLPYVIVLHFNYRCNASCDFCSRAEDIHSNSTASSSASTMVDILTAAREISNAIYFAGGEPLLDAHVVDSLRAARELRFYPICLNTNGTLLDRRMEVLRYTDHTIVSLHGTAPSRISSILRVTNSLATRVMSNILAARDEAARHGNDVVVHCVVTGSTVDDAYSVFDFCRSNNLRFSIVPAIEDFQPSPTLFDAASQRSLSDEYQALMDAVIEEKVRRPRSVVASLGYLKKIRLLEPFDCRPTGILSISPTGEILNPCTVKYGSLPPSLGKIVKGGPSIKDMLRKSLDYTEMFSTCPKRCLKACYVEPALAIEHPFAALREQMHAWEEVG